MEPQTHKKLDYPLLILPPMKHLHAFRSGLIEKLSSEKDPYEIMLEFILKLVNFYIACMTRSSSSRGASRPSRSAFVKPAAGLVMVRCSA